ncbi:MAG: SMC-Scp complex subunit ScpB [Candidatus Hodarchaeales archaeon]
MSEDRQQDNKEEESEDIEPDNAQDSSDGGNQVSKKGDKAIETAVPEKEEVLTEITEITVSEEETSEKMTAEIADPVENEEILTEIAETTVSEEETSEKMIAESADPVENEEVLTEITETTVSEGETSEKMATESADPVENEEVLTEIIETTVSEGETSEKMATESADPVENEGQVNEEEVTIDTVILDEESVTEEKIDPEEFQEMLEGAFFAAGRPLSLDKLVEIFDPLPPSEIKRYIQAITMKLTETKSAMRLEEISKDTYVLCLINEFEELVKPFIGKTKKGLFSDPLVLEVITNIAYRQPISLAMLTKIISDRVNSQDVKKIVSTLVKEDYVIAIEKGRSTQLRVTTKFLDAFGFNYDSRKMKLQLLWRLKRGK